MKAVDGTVETPVLVRNNGPRPNRPGMNFNNIDSGRVSPVSYTHLDVYKRQI